MRKDWRAGEGAGDVARNFLEELKEKVKKGKALSKWEEERRSFFEGRGMGER